MIKMPKRENMLSRRDFLRTTTAATAGTLLGGSTLFEGVARAAFSEPEPEEVYLNPRISLIIDDVGYNRSRVMPFLELGVPITFSVLPHLTYSCKLADKIHADGHEVMLHQPMEPYDRKIDPGPGALYLGQTVQEMNSVIVKNLESFPFAVGVNNHMGSRFTESQNKVAESLKVFRERDFYFIDSFTSSNSVAFETARQLRMRSAFRNVFIDNVWDKDYICSQLAKLKRHARRFGHAIGIGHPRLETVRALEEFFDGAEEEGFVFTYASKIVYT